MLKPMQVSVEKDLSGGVKITLGPTIALMSPEQAFEFAVVILKAAGVEMEIGPLFPATLRPKHFRPG